MAAADRRLVVGHRAASVTPATILERADRRVAPSRPPGTAVLGVRDPTVTLAARATRQPYLGAAEVVGGTSAREHSSREEVVAVAVAAVAAAAAVVAAAPAPAAAAVVAVVADSASQAVMPAAQAEPAVKVEWVALEEREEPEVLAETAGTVAVPLKSQRVVCSTSHRAISDRSARTVVLVNPDCREFPGAVAPPEPMEPAARAAAVAMRDRAVREARAAVAARAVREARAAAAALAAVAAEARSD